MSNSIPPPPGGGAPPKMPPCPILPPPLDGSANAPPRPMAAPLLHELPLPPPKPLPPDAPPATEGRDAKGRFAPGNPGRLPGVRNKITIAMESLLEGQWEALANTALQMALRGDSVMLKVCLDRLVPVRRGSSTSIPDFPKVETVADVPKAQAAILAAVAAGILTADEATPLSALLSAFVQAELEKQVEETRDSMNRSRTGRLRGA
jgi:hypothetical protein